MTSWHSLSGYLEYRTGGALGKLKGSRRLWFILEDSSSLLLFYKSKEEATKQRDAKGKIPLQGAGITLNPKEQNQFVVICGEKEHFFTADNHESMMVWLMGLQAKRDFFTKKRHGLSSTSEVPFSPADIIKEEYEVIQTPPVEKSRDDNFGLPLLPTLPVVSSPINDAGTQNEVKRKDETKPKVSLKDTQRSLTTSTLDLFRRQKNQQQWRQQRLKKIIGESMDGGLDLYKEQDVNYFDDLKTPDGSKEFLGLPELPTIKRESMFYSTASLLCEDNVFVPDTVMSADETMMTGEPPGGKLRNLAGLGITKASSEGMDVNKGFAGAAMTENQRRSGSGRSGSSDSLLDRNSEIELLSQLNELEQQLINTKCEMAMLLNRETCFKEVLERRDSVIIELDIKLDELAKKKAEDKKTSDKRLREEARQLQNQNRFLNEEVKRLTQLRQREVDNVQHHNSRIEELQNTLDLWKQDYVYVLQSTITIPTGDVIDGMDVTLYGGSRHRERVQALLDECRQTNPCLPTFQRLARSEVHIDNYGFKHTYPTEGLMLHYICQQLHRHYQTRLSGWEQHQRAWREVLRRSGPRLYKTKQIKLLCRQGIPDQLRAEVWRKLVHAQVGQLMEEKGPQYYNHLVNMAYDSQYAGRYRKQIMLDLLRTMPNNVNFKTKESEGILRMKEVLQAFCMHNPDIGYCQGLNFIVGMCLLFLNTEDTFWTLVAITEKYFSANYFDKSLTGAQADQEVLKDMLKFKLPTICDHLQSIDIEISTVTFNWFLAIFFDAVPFQTMVHIWDCFLLEGPKVLFRFSLAILKMNEPGILAKKDTINVMRHLKVCGKLMYDTKGLVRVAFEELKPFPRRRDIAAKQVVYLNALKEKLKKREEYRRALEEKNKQLDELDMIPPAALVYECAATCGQDLAWICVGEQNLGRVLSVHCGEALARDTEIEVESHILSVCCLEDEMFLIGTLSRILHAYSINTMRELWCLTLNDSIFSLCCRSTEASNRLFAGMGDGTVAIMDQLQPKEPQEEPFYIPVGRSPVGAIVLVGDLVWLACGNAIHLMQAQSLDMLDKISISSNPFDHVLMVARSNHGIWTTIKGSSVLELWDVDLLTCKLLFDVRFNKIVPRKGDEDGSLNKYRITTVLPVEDMLWVGTGDGMLTMYSIHDRSHLRRNLSSGSLLDGRPYSPKELRRHRKNLRDGSSKESRSRGSRSKLRNSREESRSREMLLNGMLDDDEEEPFTEERARARYPRKADKRSSHGTKGTEMKSSRRSRVQELRTQKILSSSCPGPDSLLSSSNKQMDAGEADLRQPIKAKDYPSKDALVIRSDLVKGKEHSKSNGDLCGDVMPTSKSKSSKGLPGAKTGGLDKAKSTSVNTIRAKLQRQRDISKKSDDDRKKVDEEIPPGNDRSYEKEGTHPPSLMEKFRASLSQNEPEQDAKHSVEDDEVFEAEEGSKQEPSKSQKRHSIHEKEALRQLLMAGVKRCEDDDEQADKDCNMNLPSKTLPDILKSTIRKTHAPPLESSVTARSCLSNMDPSIHVCSPSSVSTLTDGDQSPPKGLVQEQIFTFDEEESPRASSGKTVNNPEASLGSTSKGRVVTSNKEGSSSKKKSRTKKTRRKLPEIAVDNYEKVDEQPRNMSHSVEHLSDTSKGSERLMPRINVILGGSTPDLTTQNLSPNAVGRGNENGCSEENLSLLRTPSSSTLSSSSFSDLTYLIDLTIQTKVKVSNRPVKCLIPTSSNGSPVILSCAGCYGDDEAVLKWSKKSGESIWTNEPVLEVCPVTNMPRRPSYMQHISQQRSFSM